MPYFPQRKWFNIAGLENQFASPNQPKGFDGAGNVLNLCTDSKPPTTVTFLTTARNKFIIQSRLNMAESNFRTTLRHYADKWLRKRVFFCSLEQGNPAAFLDASHWAQLRFQNGAPSTSAVCCANAISECARENRNAMTRCSQLDTVKIRSRKNTVTQKYSDAKIRRPKNPAGNNSQLRYGSEQPWQ